MRDKAISWCKVVAIITASASLIGLSLTAGTASAATVNSPVEEQADQCVSARSSYDFYADSWGNSDYSLDLTETPDGFVGSMNVCVNQFDAPTTITLNNRQIILTRNQNQAIQTKWEIKDGTLERRYIDVQYSGEHSGQPVRVTVSGSEQCVPVTSGWDLNLSPQLDADGNPRFVITGTMRGNGVDGKDESLTVGDSAEETIPLVLPASYTIDRWSGNKLYRVTGSGGMYPGYDIPFSYDVNVMEPRDFVSAAAMKEQKPSQGGNDNPGSTTPNKPDTPNKPSKPSSGADQPSKGNGDKSSKPSQGNKPGNPSKPTTGDNKPVKVFTYRDVHTSDWFYAAVQEAGRKGLMTGYKNGKFGPYDSITREQAALTLYRAAGEPKVSDRVANYVDAGRIDTWAKDAVKWAYQSNVMHGYGPAGRKVSFGPQNTLTRAECATILARINKDPARSVTDGLVWAVKHDVIHGWPDRRGLDPDGRVDRAQMAKILVNASKGGYLF